MNVMAECEVSVISGISKLEEKGLLFISVEDEVNVESSVEDELNVEPMIEEQSVVDEESVVTGAQDDEAEQSVVDEDEESVVTGAQDDEESVITGAQDDEESVVTGAQDEGQTIVVEGANEDSVVTNAPVDEEVIITSSQDEEGANEDSVVTNAPVDEEVIITGSQEQVDAIEEFPPLLSKGVLISPAVEYVRSTGNWVNAIKKPHRRFYVKAETEKRGSVASSRSSTDESIVDTAANGSNTSSSFSIDSPRIEDVVVKDEHAKSHAVEDEVVEEQIKLSVDEETDSDARVQMEENKIEDNRYEKAVEEVREAKEAVESKEKEMDSLISIVRTSQIALSLNDMDTEAYERQMLAEEHLKTIEVELDILKSLLLKYESRVAALGAEDDASEVVTSKAEEKERKEGDPKLKGSKIKLIEEKSEKKRRKRHRMKERRKAAAVARDGGSSLPNEEEPQEANEATSSEGEIREPEAVEGKGEPEEQPSEGNTTQLESELRSQLRQKRKEKKLARKRSKKAKTPENETTMDHRIWLMVVVAILIFFCLKYLDLQIH